MNKVSFLFTINVIILVVIFTGCKTGGLLEMEQDENKQFMTQKINIGRKNLIVDLPFEFSSKFENQPVDIPEMEFVDKSEKARQFKDNFSFSVVHNVFSSELLPSIINIGYDEALKVTVDEDFENIKKHSEYKNVKLLSNKSIFIGKYSGREILINYVYKSKKVSTKAIYIMFENELLIIGFDFLTDDDGTTKIVDKTLKSIKIE